MIAAERIQQVAEIVRRAGLNQQTVSALRESFPDLHFSHCLEDDVGAATPTLTGETFALYLIDGRDHCLRLTTDPEAATGILLAEIDDEA